MAGNVAASAFSLGTPQKDGRVWVSQKFTDLVGIVHERFYLTNNSANAATQLASDATQHGLDLQNGEIGSNVATVMALGSLANPTFIYSTGAQNFAALRTAYQTATQLQAVFIGDYLSSLTSAQLQTAFAMTAAQVTTLRSSKLTPAANLATSIRASVGQ